MSAGRAVLATVRDAVLPPDLPGRRALGALLLPLAVTAALLLTPVGRAAPLLLGVVVAALGTLAAAVPAVVALRRAPARRTQLRFLLLGILVWTASHVVLVHDVLDGGLDPLPPSRHPFAVAILLLATAVLLDDRRSTAAPVAVEALVVIGGGATTTAAVLAGPVVLGWVPPLAAFALLVPGTWLALVVVVLARRRLPGRRPGRRDVRLVLGLLLLAVAEATFLVPVGLAELGRLGQPGRLLAYVVGLLLLSTALARPPTGAADGVRRPAVVPVVVVSATSVLLVALNGVLPPPFGPVVVATAVVTSVAVHVLLAVTLRTAGGAHAAHEDALTDDLTGAANRRALRREVGSRASRGALGLVLVDLDGFKGVNDAYGHAAGDAVLVATAARLRAAAGPDALVARLGGDEFAVLVRGADAGADAVTALAGRCAVALGRPVEHDGALLPGAGSVGTARCLLTGAGPEDAATALDHLLRTADRAMYAVKASRPPRPRGPVGLEDPAPAAAHA
ncbi:GGDEF domain-containing protein [Pseudokineococcus lusitanus]|uniref:Diguanylate cyclase (GGDEF)-like protein n=1 Tax=Pseudokineococcus lusitanus TaxID=763993 RepID=A0A3N1G9L8_9ACTN|nr:GGDEF domain-containing protein [Pseudokineococcus lusitanus]ROP26935.1 diguanylate cyclase (GGDEF)-like protein [Pseudokineococcus lusitanus]